ncbi:MAG: porin [Psychromonas sp.]|nr:porin [Psychromonas sp.]
MKKSSIILVALGITVATPAVLATESSYITGNVQMHDRKDFNGSDYTSTLETGHTFSKGTTLLVEFDAIQLGQTDYAPNNDSANSSASPAWITIGLEQAFNVNKNFWVAAGYHHLLHDGGTVQYRPLVKIGYNFDNGISFANRTRWQIQKNDWVDINGNINKENTNDQWRFDDAISYAFPNQPVTLRYNNIYYINDANNKRNSMEHELRTTWRRYGVQPYIEYRNQQDATKQNYGHNNNVLVLGATLAF